MNITILIDSEIVDKVIFDCMVELCKHHKLNIIVIEKKASFFDSIKMFSFSRVVMYILHMMEKIKLNKNSISKEFLKVSIEKKFSFTKITGYLDAVIISSIKLILTNNEVDKVVSFSSLISTTLLSSDLNIEFLSLFSSSFFSKKNFADQFNDIQTLFLVNIKDGVERVVSSKDFSRRGYYSFDKAYARYNAIRLLQKYISNPGGQIRYIDAPKNISQIFSEEYPSFLIAIKYAMYSLSLILKRNILIRIFPRWQKFDVIYSRSNNKNIDFTKGKRLPSVYGKSLADPFLFKYAGDHYCFAEEFSIAPGGKGSIVVYKMYGESFIRLGICLSEDFHLSYPFVFEDEGVIYMIPESSENGDIRLYQAEEFPLKWKLVEVLIKDVSAVDTMVFKRDGFWWLFTSINHFANEASFELSLFYSADLRYGNWIPHKRNPVIVSPFLGRNGGYIFDGDSICRVGQRIAKDQYGKSLTLHKICNLSIDEYIETQDNSVKFKLPKDAVGFHHLNNIDDIYVVDVIRDSFILGRI